MNNETVIDFNEKTWPLIKSALKEYPDETLLSWAGYNSKQEWEDVVDEPFSRKALIEYNFEDIWESLTELG